MLLLFSVHQMALGLFRMLAAVARDMVIANTFGSAALLAIFLLGGFIIPRCKDLSFVDLVIVFTAFSASMKNLVLLFSFY